MSIRILSGGMFTTVQDRGRSGYMKSGITVSGAMDERSYETANRLVGNTNGEAALEVTLIGPVIEFSENCVFAIAGADLGPQMNGKDIPMYRALGAKAGDTLSFAGRRGGCRAYLAFRGGIAVPPVLGSRATDIKAGIGGLMGRKLQAGDMIPIAPASGVSFWGIAEKEDFSAAVKLLRVVMGPQDDRFTEAGINAFLHTEYTVTAQSDRMGIRLSGEAVETKSGSDIITDGICMGAVQIPADGQPILMMADRQPTGGYAKIANVISVDLPVAAQTVPGDKVRFQCVSVQEAQALLLTQQEKLKNIRAFREASVSRYRVRVDGYVYNIEVRPAD
ncbi:MAG: biotin-dependent carboxyltransferase family protein [Clostridiales bacterium]|nr:biotin-dependent carboxyltransferase family protein [Clostridiales bacterium]